jgi:ABC-type polysaccharide/polyol phosphate export permease
MPAVIEDTGALVARVLIPTRHRLRVADIWTTRSVAWMIGVRDVKSKYKQAALGPLWLIIAPLGLLAAVTVAFSGVTDVNTSGIAYLPFALAGLTVWIFVQLSLTIGTQLLITNSQLVRRSPLPRIALITGSLLGNIPPFAVMLTMLVGVTAFDRGLPLQALLIPFLCLWLFLLTFAVTLFVSALAARYRDLVSAMPLVIQAGIFVTPVGYGLEGAPSNIHAVLSLNPIAGLIEAWRWAVLDLPDPNVTVIGVSGVLTVLALVIGWRVFGRLEVDFADFV